MKILGILFQWVVVAGVLIGGWYLIKSVSFPHPDKMPGFAVVVFSLACAFVWVEVLKWGVTKPFNCVKCMCGWFSLGLALIFHTPHWYLYLPLGVFVGAMYSGIKMRYL